VVDDLDERQVGIAVDVAADAPYRRQEALVAGHGHQPGDLVAVLAADRAAGRPVTGVTGGQGLLVRAGLAGQAGGIAVRDVGKVVAAGVDHHGRTVGVAQLVEGERVGVERQLGGTVLGDVQRRHVPGVIAMGAAATDVVTAGARERSFGGVGVTDAGCVDVKAVETGGQASQPCMHRDTASALP